MRINNGLTVIALSGLGGMIPGAIGAASATGNHPVIKGALITGAVNALVTGIWIAAVNTADQERLSQGSVSGSFHNPRFP